MDVIRAPVAESNEDFVLKKVKRTALKTLKILETSKKKEEFLQDFKDLKSARYRSQVKKENDEILGSIRKRVVRET